MCSDTKKVKHTLFLNNIWRIICRWAFRSRNTTGWHHVWKRRQGRRRRHRMRKADFYTFVVCIKRKRNNIFNDVNNTALLVGVFIKFEFDMVHHIGCAKKCITFLTKVANKMLRFRWDKISICIFSKKDVANNSEKVFCTILVFEYKRRKRI